MDINNQFNKKIENHIRLIRSYGISQKVEDQVMENENSTEFEVGFLKGLEHLAKFYKNELDQTVQTNQQDFTDLINLICESDLQEWETYQEMKESDPDLDLERYLKERHDF